MFKNLILKLYLFTNIIEFDRNKHGSDLSKKLTKLDIL